MEAAAAACTLLANATLLHRLCTDAAGKVPIAVLVLQASGNFAWMSHSGIAGDPYLFATATASLALQLLSLGVRSRSECRRRRAVAGDDSLEALPQLPPPQRSWPHRPWPQVRS